MSERNWIVIAGHLVNTVEGGGLEFFGPFTEKEALRFKSKSRESIRLAVQLLKGLKARHV